MVWVIPNLYPTTFSFTPFYFKVGNHRVMLVNFKLDYLLEEDHIPLYQTCIWRLVSKYPYSVTNYIKQVEKLLIEYRIPKKINSLIISGNSFHLEQCESSLSKINNKIIQILLESKKKCRQLHTRYIAFSPKLSRIDLT